MIPLTGDPKADADIMAFMRARQHIAQQGDLLLKHLSAILFNLLLFSGTKPKVTHVLIENLPQNFGH